MRLEQFNFHHLLYFWKVAKLGHLTQAAEALHISQSALSSQIKQFEERLGEPLFHRKGRKLVLTGRGRWMLSYADDIFGLGGEMLSRLERQDQGVISFRVGSVSTMSRNYQENWIRPLLHDPSVSLRLESGALDHLLHRLREHELDVVLANEAVTHDQDTPLLCQFLGSQAISLVGPANMWAERSLRIPEDLDGIEIALPGKTNSLRGQFDAMALRTGVKPLIRAEVDDMAMLRLIARDSGWLAILPEVVVQDELKTGTLVTVGQSSELREHFYAITNPHRLRSERLERLLANVSGLQVEADKLRV